MRYALWGSLSILLLAGCVSTDADTQGTRMPISAVDKMPKALNNQPASLKGRIVREAGSNQYVVSDGTGEVLVDIPRDVARGQQFPAGTEVEIKGLVNSRAGGGRIEAASVDVLGPADGASAIGAGR